MKRAKFISSILSVMLVIATILGSSGLTIISHNCHACHQVSYSVESFFSQYSVEDDCCCDAHASIPFSQQCMISNRVCELHVEMVKIGNSVTGKLLVLTPITDRPEIIKILPSSESEDLLPAPVPYCNKHGGRSLINSICQLIS